MSSLVWSDQHSHQEMVTAESNDEQRQEDLQQQQNGLCETVPLTEQYLLDREDVNITDRHKANNCDGECHIGNRESETMLNCANVAIRITS